MTLIEAEEIVSLYGAALARGLPHGGIARRESFLPCPKDRIKQAFKLVLAALIEHRSLTPQNRDMLLTTILYLDQFVSDAAAASINTSVAGGTFTDEYLAFSSTSMVSISIHAEMDDFIATVERLDADDTLFYQRVYTLIGLEYPPPKLLEHLFGTMKFNRCLTRLSNKWF